jgi:GTP-binding protein Era
MNSTQELPHTELETPAHFRSGYVAVIGKPNVGKSTLLNAYLGQKISIVSNKPQTTRERILGILTQPEAQVIFIDTPGIHAPKHALGKFMMDVAYGAINEADVVVFMVDVTLPPDEDDQRIAQALHDQPETRSVILALNKMDRAPSPEKLKANVEAYWALAQTPADQQPPAPWDWIMLSATNSTNSNELLGKIISALPEGPQYFPADQVTDRQEKDIAAELIREQALLHLKQEVPHSVAVAIEQYDERPNGSVHITATIYVERDSQKGIMIGSGGKMLKQIGADARHEIQRLVDNKVFLELWVKVRKNWREDEREVRNLGYTSEE